jgi:serine/threonine protein kinase
MSDSDQQKVLEAQHAELDEASGQLQLDQIGGEHSTHSTTAGSLEKSVGKTEPLESGVRGAEEVMSEEKSGTEQQGPAPFIGPTRPRSEELTRVELLGTGNFSSIYLAEEYRSRRVTALKVYARHEVERRKKTDDVLMEKYVLNKLKGCRRVVQLLETFKDDFNLYFNMEFLKGGELFELCAGFGLPSRFELKYFLYKILLALEEIHQRGIVHRDLKPENILLTDTKTDLKLIDFATSWDLQNPAMKGSGNGSTGRRVYYHFVGTPQYMPPELVRNRGSFEATDVYALGCICGFTPFLGPGEYAIFKLSTQPDKMKFYGFFTDEEKDLIRSMCHIDHEKRITVQQLKTHPYFQDHLALYQSTLDSYQQLEALRSPQDTWLLRLRENILQEVADTYPDAQPKTQPSEHKKLTKEQLLELDQPKFISVPAKDSETADEQVEAQPQPEAGAEEKPAGRAEVQFKQEKRSLIQQRIKEAESAMPEGEYSASFMKSRLWLLQRQLENKTRVKFFEHH